MLGLNFDCKMALHVLVRADIEWFRIETVYLTYPGEHFCLQNLRFSCIVYTVGNKKRRISRDRYSQIKDKKIKNESDK